MLTIINSLLDLWDPYDLYLFPHDEYTPYAMKIYKLIVEDENVSIDTLTNFVYTILPPIVESNSSELLLKVEYKRFATTVLLIFKNAQHLKK